MAEISEVLHMLVQRVLTPEGKVYKGEASRFSAKYKLTVPIDLRKSVNVNERSPLRQIELNTLEPIKARLGALVLGWEVYQDGTDVTVNVLFRTPKSLGPIEDLFGVFGVLVSPIAGLVNTVSQAFIPSHDILAGNFGSGIGISTILMGGLAVVGSVLLINAISGYKESEAKLRGAERSFYVPTSREIITTEQTRAGAAIGTEVVKGVAGVAGSVAKIVPFL